MANFPHILSKPQFIRFSSAQQVLLIRRLALYLHAGVSLSAALAFILEDTQATSARRVLESIERTVSTGHSLSEGLAAYPRIFGSFTIGFVSAGEMSGTLADTLERLAHYQRKENTLRSKLLSALAYPALVLVGTIGVAAFLTLFIFPKIIPVLQGFRTTLPFSTRVLIALNKVISHDGIWIFLFLVFIGIAFVISLRDRRIRKLAESVTMSIPILSTLRKSYSLSTFARTLAIQLSGGIRILPALTMTNNALSSLHYRDALRKIEKELMEGQRFSVALRLHPQLFPPIVCQLISVGEATGTISTNLFTIADLYEETLDELAKNLTVLVEPILMIVMGFIVGFVALAIITPIYQVTQNLSAS